MSDPTGGASRVSSIRVDGAAGSHVAARPEETVWGIARVVAAAELEGPFADAKDAFATWLAYHLLLNEVRRLACRLLGAQDEIVQLLRPWLEPASVPVAPQNAAGRAWVRATRLLEIAQIRGVPSARASAEDGERPTLEVDSQTLLCLAEVMLVLAAAGESLAHKLTSDGASVRSAALRLEARRLRRHAPRLALAAVNTLEALRRGPAGADLAGGEATRRRPVSPTGRPE